MGGSATPNNDCASEVCHNSTTDCAVHCLATNLAAHTTEPATLLALVAIVLVLVSALVRVLPLAPPGRLLLRIFPPPLYLFATVRLIE